jgi:hypothetical protein
MTFKEIIQEIPLLSEAERKQLMLILETLDESKPHSIFEFAGFAEELYDGIDAQDYVNQLRNDWDERP